MTLEPPAASGPPPSHDDTHRPRFAWLRQARWGVQLLCAAFIVLVGVEFARFFDAALAGHASLPRRPASVEALLPLSALLGLKRLVLTGAWDDLHPAGLTILLAVVLSAIAARKAFCSWVCPVGTLSRGLEWLGVRTRLMRRGKRRAQASWLGGLAYLPKYLVLAFFALSIVVLMDGRAVAAFLASPYNHVTDARMLLFFRHPSMTVLVVIGAFVVGSLFVRHLWCRFFCPYGALLGLFSWASPQRIVRDASTCTSCKRCTQVCPVRIRVHTELRVLTPECTGCLDCVAVCPVDDCLTLGRTGRRGWSPLLVPVLAIAVLLGAWLTARATGHWYSKLPATEFAWWYRHAEDVGHEREGALAPSETPTPGR
jgi:polyferredoxin